MKEKAKKIVKWVILIVGVVCLFVIIHIFTANRTYEKEFYQVVSDQVEENIRIVYLTDTHLKEYGEDNADLVADVKSLSPDLVLLGGDMIIRETEDYKSAISLCEQLSKIAPTYGVFGNHELERIYQDGDKNIADAFAKTGVTFLRNSDTEVEIKGTSIQLVGISGTEDGFNESGGKKEMDSLEDNADFRIVMSHIPAQFLENLAAYDFDLGLAGHVHGGIVRLPVIGGLYSAEEGFLPTYSAGAYELDNGGELIVSRGLGDSAAIPLRINSKPELSVIDINWY